MIDSRVHSSQARSSRLVLGGVLLLGSMAGVGCEDLSTDASPAPSTGAQSALGKAKERAERTVDQINRHQQELVQQADTVFDDRAARRLEAERRAADGGM